MENNLSAFLWSFQTLNLWPSSSHPPQYIHSEGKRGHIWGFVGHMPYELLIQFPQGSRGMRSSRKKKKDTGIHPQCKETNAMAGIRDWMPNSWWFKQHQAPSNQLPDSLFEAEAICVGWKIAGSWVSKGKLMYS